MIKFIQYLKESADTETFFTDSDGNKVVTIGQTVMDDDSYMADTDAIMKKLGFSKSDYFWAIGRGDDMPNAVVIKNKKVLANKAAMKQLRAHEGDEGEAY